MTRRGRDIERALRAAADVCTELTDDGQDARALGWLAAMIDLVLTKLNGEPRTREALRGLLEASQYLKASPELLAPRTCCAGHQWHDTWARVQREVEAGRLQAANVANATQAGLVEMLSRLPAPLRQELITQAVDVLWCVRGDVVPEVDEA